MPKIKEKEYLSIEEYFEAKVILHSFSIIILSQFALLDRIKRNNILSSFIARCDRMVHAIFQLCEGDDLHDSWIIHRCLIDRLFHIHDLGEKDEFELFEDWSFFEQYKALNKVNSDQSIKDFKSVDDIKLTDHQKKRGKKLEKNPPKWRRPHAEQVAKDLNMQFFYKYGYDYASRYVHPMANEGEIDFNLLLEFSSNKREREKKIILSNTLLVYIVILQESLRISDYLWVSMVNNFLTNTLLFLDNGSNDFKLDLLKLSKYFRSYKNLAKAKK